MEQVLLIVNPSSGGEKAQVYEKMAANKLKTIFKTVEIVHTEKAGDAKKFAAQAAEKRYHAVFVMGGDGTVNEGISGLAEQAFRPRFGFFPLGTVNDLARALGMPLDIQQAIDEFTGEKTTKADLGKINDAYFMNVVAIGRIPEAINDVDAKEKTKFGKLAYFLAGIKQLSKSETYDFELEIDGQALFIHSSTLLIGSTNSIGGFEQLFPEAEVNDGVLHLLYLKDETFLDTVKAVPSLLKGVAQSNQNVGYLTFAEAKIRLRKAEHEPLQTNVDGDPGAELPVEIKVLPQHLTVFYG
jgi:YegS/Rv2252/BmrU family lipid kinase